MKSPRGTANMQENFEYMKCIPENAQMTAEIKNIYKI